MFYRFINFSFIKSQSQKIRSGRYKNNKIEWMNITNNLIELDLHKRRGLWKK
jgi:hypothetical protein